jgi:mRNA interferase RelE/StbE
MQYRLVYSETVRDIIKNLHPDLKSIVRARLKKIADNPYIGKPLVKELSGYFSLKAKRYRIIYKIQEESHIIQIHYLGHRKDIYQLFKEQGEI